MNDNAKWLTRAAFLLAVALLFQFVKLGQYVTGPAINATLLIATVLVSTWGAVGIGILTPLTAYLAGVLNPVLAPAIPFIMAGNAALTLVFGYGRKANVYLAVAGGAVAKLLVMYTGVRYLVPAFFGVNLPPPVAVALTWPQLITAVAGAILAFLVLEGLTAAGLIARFEWPGLGRRVESRNDGPDSR